MISGGVKFTPCWLGMGYVFGSYVKGYWGLMISGGVKFTAC
jgi:hypothetical protein